MDVLGVLNIAIEIEKAGHSLYSQLAEGTNDAKGKEMFVWLAQQELGHLNSLQKLKEVVTEISSEVTTLTTAFETLLVAIHLERAYIDLYRRMERSAADPSTKMTFDMLVAEEQTHLLILEAQLKAMEQSQTFVPLDELPSELLG